MEGIAGIEEAYIISRGHLKPLVHGIIQSFVRFADNLMNVVAVFLDERHRTICRSTVYNDVLNAFVGLRNNTLDGVFQYFLGVIGDGDNREFGVRMAVLISSASQAA